MNCQFRGGRWLFPYDFPFNLRGGVKGPDTDLCPPGEKVLLSDLLGGFEIFELFSVFEVQPGGGSYRKRGYSVAHGLGFFLDNPLPELVSLERGEALVVHVGKALGEGSGRKAIDDTGSGVELALTAELLSSEDSEGSRAVEFAGNEAAPIGSLGLDSKVRPGHWEPLRL